MLLSFFLGIFTHCPIKVKCLLIMCHICVMSVVGKKISLIWYQDTFPYLPHSFRKTRHNYFGRSSGDHNVSHLLSCGLFLICADFWYYISWWYGQQFKMSRVVILAETFSKALIITVVVNILTCKFFQTSLMLLWLRDPIQFLYVLRAFLFSLLSFFFFYKSHSLWPSPKIRFVKCMYWEKTQGGGIGKARLGKFCF